MKYIYGISKSGKSIIDYLNSINEEFFCWDDNKKIRTELKKNDKKIQLIEPHLLDYSLVDSCFVSPGISFNNKKIDIIKKNKINLYRDLELYSQLIKILI